jgi:hypothetical protein
MAIARTSAIIGAISGTLGSTTFRNTRAGLVLAAHGQKRNQRTPLQLRTAALLAAYQNAWFLLSDHDKRQWAEQAATITWPNRLGIPKRPTGRNLFLLCCLHFWDPTWPPNATSPNDLAEIGNPIMSFPEYPQTPPPTSWSVTQSLTTGTLVTSDSPILPDSSLYEFLWFSPWLSPTQTSAPQRWIKLGRRQKITTTMDWSDWGVRANTLLQLGQTIALALTWQRFPSVPSIRSWRIVQVSA